ncbi:hypothetical protein I4U23_004419 [Adineta vaga]|nr:hypothetical protein I4U23_004419 [Adineta vaga]
MSKNLEDFSLIWLDDNLDEDPDRRVRLRGIINYLKLFKTSDECIQYITSIKNETIFFIVSGKFGQSVVPIIHDMSQVAYIYIYCSNKGFHEEWIKPFKKIRDVLTNISEVFDKLKDDVTSLQKTLPPPITICNFMGMKDKSIQDLDKESATFLWFHLLVEILLRLPDSTTIDAKTEMLDECRLHYDDNDFELGKIKDFEKNYSPENALQWYTHDSFLYRLINRAFRTEDIDIIFKFRFFICDLFNQMLNIYNQTSKTSENLTVYRGQMMTTDEFNKIRHNVDNLISINTFFSTTTSCEIALLFAGEPNHEPSMESVIFQIEINTDLVKNPFVNLIQESKYKHEKEILLSMGFLFRIDEIDQLDSGHWSVSLTAVNEQDTKTNELLTYLKNEIGESSTLLQLGEFLGTMGEYKKSRHYYEILLKQLPIEHRDIADV